MGELINKWGSAYIGKYGYSSVGAVVGATYPEEMDTLRKVMPKSYILVPGYGAQGGTAKDIINSFNEDGLGAIVNSSRGIIGAYKKEEYRLWDPFRSKLAASLLKGLQDFPIKKGLKILYLGASTGTTISHISDIIGNTGVIFAVESSMRVARELIENVADKRENIIPKRGYRY